MCRQEEILNDYYSRVIEKFGYDNIIGLLRQIEKLEEIMESDFIYKGECAGDGGS